MGGGDPVGGRAGPGEAGGDGQREHETREPQAAARGHQPRVLHLSDSVLISSRARRGCGRDGRELRRHFVGRVLAQRPIKERGGDSKKERQTRQERGGGVERGRVNASESRGEKGGAGGKEGREKAAGKNGTKADATKCSQNKSASQNLPHRFRANNNKLPAESEEANLPCLTLKNAPSHPLRANATHHRPNPSGLQTRNTGIA